MTMPQSTNGGSSSSSSSSIPLASLLVARFLRYNNYAATLETFIREAGLPPDAGSTSTEQNGRGGRYEYDDWTLEGVIQEKKTFDQSLRFERYGDDDDDDGRKRDRWSVPAPSKPTLVDTPGSSNLLSVSVEPWQQQEEQDDVGSYLVATAADKSLNLFDVGRSNQVVASLSGLSDSPILSYVSIRGGRYQLATSMSGQLLLIKNAEVLDRRKDHSKYAVKVVAYEDEDEDDRVWIVTAGWDAKVLIYRMTLSSSSPTTIGQPVATIKLPTNPESILIVRNPDSRELMLLVSRHDSTYIYYYALEPLRSSEENQQQQQQQCECVLRGKQNLAPHSNAWIAFSPSCMAPSPHDPGLLAVALSTLPHMKVMIVRLLFPSSDSVDNTAAATATATAEPAASSSSSSTQETHLSQALAALSLQNREDAAIVIQANTFAPQTAYSTPQVVWRPDGSGLWVNGDDGVIRGIEAKTGKVVAMLKDGHEAGSKVRSIWAGWVSCSADSGSSSEGKEDNKKEEWVVSGGFDKRLVVWRI